MNGGAEGRLLWVELHPTQKVMLSPNKPPVPQNMTLFENRIIAGVIS